MPTAPNGVADALQKSASLHWTAVEHYTSVAEHLDRYGYKKLGSRFKADAEEERGHLHAVMERLEFYGVQPTYQHAPPSFPRGDVPGILAASLALETATAATERANVIAARSVGDELSALVFADLLKGSEESIKDIEADQFVIGQIGLDNYLANQT